jgi:DNA mismatch endonuclease, patch repair protein
MRPAGRYRGFWHLPDIVDPETRSRMMAGIRGKDTQPELMIRRALHRLGFRFRLHDRRLPGRPDLVFPQYRAVIFVHGCFWHGHDCPTFRWPKTRRSFWRSKIEGNRERDARSCREIAAAGWRLLTVWECATRGKYRRREVDLVLTIANWLACGKSGRIMRGIRNGSDGRPD